MSLPDSVIQSVQKIADLLGDALKSERVMQTTAGKVRVSRNKDGTLEIAELEPFDRIVVISMDTENGRARLKRLFAELDRIKWPWKMPEVFNAVIGAKVPKPRGWRSGSGAWGCLRSHQMVLERAMQDDIRRLLVMEDDAEWCDDIARRGPEFLASVPGDYDQLMLGGQFVTRGREPLAEDLSEGVLRVAGVERTHAYAVQGAFMANLYTLWQRANRHCDQEMGPLQHGRRVYAPTVWLAGQARGKSDISGRELTARTWQRKAPPTPRAKKKSKPCCGSVVRVLSAPQRFDDTPRQTALGSELAAHGGKLLHQVWVQGESELPEDYRKNRDAWRAALPAGWRMVLWDE